MLERSLTIREAAAALHVSYGTVYAAIHTGRLRAYKFGSRGGTYRIDPADLEAYKASRRHDTQATFCAPEERRKRLSVQEPGRWPFA